MTLYRRRSVLLVAAAALLLVVSLISGRGGSGSGTVEPLVQIVSILRRPLTAGVRIAPADLAGSSVPSRSRSASTGRCCPIPPSSRRFGGTSSR